MDKVLSKIMTDDLNSKQELELLKGIAVVKLYSDLEKTQDILQFLKPTNRVALFFPTSANASSPGHWLAVWYNPKTNTLHHFDSYGLSPEQEIQFSSNPAVDKGVIVSLYQKAQASGIKLSINSVHYQARTSGVNTCGRHVICRLRFSYMTDAEYEKMMIGQKMNPDMLVTLLTLLALDEDQQLVGQILSNL